MTLAIESAATSNAVDSAGHWTWPCVSATMRAIVCWLSGPSRTELNSMIKLVLLMGLAWLLAGCVDVTSTAAADGRALYTIDCDGESRGCFDKAGDLCPGGYYLIERKSGSNEVRYTAGLITTPYTKLVIECK